MSCKAWRGELPCKGPISKWLTWCPPKPAASWVTAPNTGFSLKMAPESCDPHCTAGGVAESREEMAADLPSAKLVSQPRAKPHLQDPSVQHVPPGSPSCHRATSCAQPAALPMYLPLCQPGTPQQGKQGQQGTWQESNHTTRIPGVFVCWLLANVCVPAVTQAQLLSPTPLRVM